MLLLTTHHTHHTHHHIHAHTHSPQLGSRLVLTIVQLLTGQRADTAPRVVLNEIFDMVVQRGPIVTKLRADTRLSHLVEEEVTGPSQRQNYKALIEEMREVGRVRGCGQRGEGVAKGTMAWPCAVRL